MHKISLNKITVGEKGGIEYKRIACKAFKM